MSSSRKQTAPWPVEGVPLRSLLFVPGDNTRMLQKAWSTGADGIILDLEDAVPEAAKAEARERVARALSEASPERISVFVRINPCSSPHWQPDVRTVVGKTLRGIVLPKCESMQGVAAVARLLNRMEKARGLPSGSVGLVLLIETARGLLRASELIQSSSRVAALAFGAEDFCLDVGISRTPNGQELLFARSYLAICARANGRVAIDSVYADFHDTEGLLRETQTCKRLGFSGKLLIHPKQVGVVHKVFMPSEGELCEARRILDAASRVEATGRGVTAIDGKMIDKPIFERARRTLAQAGSRQRR